MFFYSFEKRITSSFHFTVTSLSVGLLQKVPIEVCGWNVTKLRDVAEVLHRMRQFTVRSVALNLFLLENSRCSEGNSSDKV